MLLPMILCASIVAAIGPAVADCSDTYKHVVAGVDHTQQQNIRGYHAVIWTNNFDAP